jgi:hypothetical protein
MVPSDILRTLVGERAEDCGSLTAKHEIGGEPAFHDIFEDGCLGVLLARGGRGPVCGVWFEEGIPGQVASKAKKAGRGDARDGHYIADGRLHSHYRKCHGRRRKDESNLTESSYSLI